MAIPRSEILKKLYADGEEGIPIIGGGAGTGISAKSEEAGGIDLIVIYNTGRYRMAGRVSITGLFAYSDANAVMMEMAGEVLPIVKKTPVLAGVNATDPFREMPQFLKLVKERGFSGVQNFPTVGLFDGIMRENMEATGLGYDKEVEMIRLAHDMDLLTTPYCFTRGRSPSDGEGGRRYDRCTCRSDNRWHDWCNCSYDVGRSRGNDNASCGRCPRNPPRHSGYLPRRSI